MTDWLDEQMEDILSGGNLPIDDFEEWQLRQDEGLTPWDQEFWDDDEDDDDVWTLEDLSYQWTGTTDSY